MEEMDVIDRFLNVFIAYIDSGFGLLQADVAYLTSTLIVIDLTLAGLFWALSEGSDVISGLLKKVLYVGFFAFLLSNFSFLADTVFQSFAGLGIKAGSATLTAEDLMRPGYIASVGFQAALPLLEDIADMLGPIAFFENFVMIAVLLIAWAVILIAFFILAVQLFVSILEFKLTTLAGFVLVPFALWNKTAFLAERVLGNVIASGINSWCSLSLSASARPCSVRSPMLFQDQTISLWRTLWAPYWPPSSFSGPASPDPASPPAL